MQNTSSTAALDQKQNLVRSIIMAGRPKTLTAALVPVLVATAYAYSQTKMVQWSVSILSLLASFFIQIATNLVNDAKDFKKGADTEKRIGPQRVTQTGLMSYQQVMMWAYLFFAMALLAGIPLVIQGGLPILIVGVLSLVFGYAYTGGPFPLAYKGLGDLFVIVFFGLVAVQGVVWLQIQEISSSSLMLGLQIGMLATVLIAINNLRDHETDVLVNKKTLPVRFGVLFGRLEIATMILAPLALQYFWWTQDRPWVAGLGLATLPLAALIIKKIFTTKPSPEYNKFLGMSALLHLAFGILMTIGFCL